MKMVPKKAARMMNAKVTATEIAFDKALRRLAPPIEAAKPRAAELNPASRQPVTSRRIAPAYN